MPRTRNSRQWREILDAFDRSDLSQAEFCRRRGLVLATFRYHHARAVARPVPPQPTRVIELFAEPAPASGEALRLELDLPLGSVTVLGQPGSLAELLRLLASGPNDVRP